MSSTSTDPLPDPDLYCLAESEDEESDDEDRDDCVDDEKDLSPSPTSSETPLLDSGSSGLDTEREESCLAVRGCSADSSSGDSSDDHAGEECRRATDEADGISPSSGSDTSSQGSYFEEVINPDIRGLDEDDTLEGESRALCARAGARYCEFEDRGGWGICLGCGGTVVGG